MVIKIILFILLCLASAMLYRAGGAGKKKKDDGFNFIRRSWVRDWVIPPVAILALWLLKGVHWNYWWSYLLVWPLMGGALSTYWDKIFGYDNMYAHGAGVGMAALSLLWVMHWWAILIYAAVVSVSMGLISHQIKLHAVKREKGRGAIIILALLILKFIG